MGLRSVALSNLESARKRRFIGGPPSLGIVAAGAYSGQSYTIIAASRYFSRWWRVILTDEGGNRAERDVRESCL